MKRHFHNATGMPTGVQNRGKCSNIPPRNGFTLLEVLLSIGIMAMLIGSVFTITNSSVMLSQSVVVNQTQHRHKISFESYLDSIFLNLPHDAQIILTVEDDPLQTLTIQNPATFFPSLQNDYFATLFTATSAKNDNDLVDVIGSYQSLVNEDSDATTIDTSDYQQNLTLISNLSTLQWEIYSTQDDTWYTTWSVDQGLPTHVRLTYSYYDSQEVETVTFWIPPRVESK